jgi:glycosyltransferase involved in cell wall biosynthesis
VIDEVDFLEGADGVAPGLSRVQAPLLQTLQANGAFAMRPVRFPIRKDALLFPFVYGPLPVWLAARRASLLHITNSWYAHVVPLIPKPVVVTCHDLIQLEDALSDHNDLKPHRRFHARATFAGMLKAESVVCDSQAIAAKVAHRAPQIAGRLHVIHPGISDVFTPGLAQASVFHELGIRPPYVLYVGSEQSRKNLDRLVAAIALVREHLSIVQFVKVGQSQTDKGRASLLDSLERESLSDSTVILDQISDDELRTLYRGAAVTVLPSLREGFGFPALEAMACGSPVIVSNRDSLPQLVGDDALVIDPLHIRQMAQAIERVVFDQALQATLRAKGLKRASLFSWKKAANQYEEIYTKAVQKKVVPHVTSRTTNNENASHP